MVLLNATTSLLLAYIQAHYGFPLSVLGNVVFFFVASSHCKSFEVSKLKVSTAKI